MLPRYLCIQSHILLRSEISRPGGSPPADVTQRTLQGRRGGRLSPSLNSRRNARSRISRKVVRVSNAFRLASSRRSSGSSTVVFIWFPILRYLRVSFFELLVGAGLALPPRSTLRTDHKGRASPAPTRSLVAAPPTCATIWLYPCFWLMDGQMAPLPGLMSCYAIPNPRLAPWAT
jgi:hypothetical protein